MTVRGGSKIIPLMELRPSAGFLRSTVMNADEIFFFPPILLLSHKFLQSPCPCAGTDWTGLIGST